MAIGETSKIESDDKGKIETIVGKVKELNGRLVDIRREQVFQRVSIGIPIHQCLSPPFMEALACALSPPFGTASSKNH